MHFDGVEGIKEFDLIELEDEFAEYLLAQEGGLFSVGEEDDPEEAVALLAGHFAHEELEVVDVKLTIKQFIFRGRILSSRDLAHVLLAAYFAFGAILLAFILEDDVEIVAGRSAWTEHFFDTPASFGVAETFDFGV